MNVADWVEREYVDSYGPNLIIHNWCLVNGWKIIRWKPGEPYCAYPPIGHNGFGKFATLEEAVTHALCAQFVG